MNFKIFLKLFIFLVLILIVFNIILDKKTSKKILRVSYPVHWGSLIPPLQHSLIGDAIIYNQFEPLVQKSEDGTLVPLACKEFEISNNFQTYKFKIDNSKRFSDGTFLTSMDFKEAFENGLRLEKVSHNKSTLDGFYDLEGFENFDKTGKIKGIIADDPQMLELHYKKPFRLALETLEGSRFSVYKIKNNEYLGTGPWIISDLYNKENLLLYPNKFHDDKKDYSIEIIATEDYISKLKNNELDVAEIANTDISDCPNLKKDNIECFLGQIQSHAVLNLNAQKNRIFSKKSNRQALLFLISELLKDSSFNKDLMNYVSDLDLQFYLPFQKGRIYEEKYRKHVQEGKKFVDSLIKETNSNPLFFATAKKSLFILNFLKSKGLKFTKNSGIFSFKDVLEMGYKTSTPDLIFLFFSVGTGDPDGLYHALGKNGAIAFPMSFNSKIARILEEGRSLTESKEIKQKYEELSLSLFEEVPVIHLGFQKQISLFNTKTVQVSHSSVRRRDYKLNIYELK